MMKNKKAFLNNLSILFNALLLLSLAISLTHSQANNSPSPTLSASPAAPTNNNNPLPTLAPSTSSLESNTPSQPTETPAATNNNPAPPSPTNLSPTLINNPISLSNSLLNSQSNSPLTQSSPSLISGHSQVTSSASLVQTISGGSSQLASSIVIVTVTRTGADGQVYTSLTSSYTPLTRPTSSSSNSSGGSGSSGNTWAIIGGIVGGLAGIGAVVFIVFRCTQRRFSDLDDEDVAFKWPELVNRVEDPSTLNPLAARPGIGHGIGEDDVDEKPRLYSHDIAMESLHSDPRHPGMYDTYQAYPPPPSLHPQEHTGYYDPYLGPSAAKQPYPGTLKNLGYDEQVSYNHHHQQQQQRSHDLHSQPSIGSSVGPPQYDTTASPRSVSRQHNHNISLSDNHHQQYPIAWDGPEDIPLTVVNNQQIPLTPLHNPYQKP